MKPDATKKHKAILDIKIIVHEVDELGQCTHVVQSSELANFNLKPRVQVTVDGFDRSDCLIKLKAKIDGFK